MAQAVLTIVGPALTSIGAGLLAYDVLRGPARLRRQRRHVKRLDAAEERRDVTTQALSDTSDERSRGEQKLEMAVVEALHANTVERAETFHATADQEDKAKTYRLAICGLFLVMAGGIAETAAAIMLAVI